jgi:hypothetical protein
MLGTRSGISVIASRRSAKGVVWGRSKRSSKGVVWGRTLVS